MSLVERIPTIQQYLSWYGWPIWFSFGSIGCILNILLFSRKQFRSISCCLYFLVASVIMLVVLFVGIIPLIYGFNHPDPTNIISSFCKARNYLLQISAMMYRWLMVGACVDRYMHTSTNHVTRHLLNIKMTHIVIMFTICFWLILPFHQVVWTDVINNVCIFTNTNVSMYNGFVTMILGGILPTLIMLVFALLIKTNLAVRRRGLHRSYQERTDNQRGNLRDQQATLMLFVQVVIFFITNLPWTIGLVYTAITTYMIKSREHILIEIFLKYLSQHIFFAYPALSFYMYTLSSKKFRQELLKMFRGIFQFFKRQNFRDIRIQPIT